MAYKQKVPNLVEGTWIDVRIKGILNILKLRGNKKISEEPDSIFNYKWDNLIILDACRHDTFQEVFGESEYRISKGSATPEFIRENFSKGDYSDIVYVTGNPHFYPDIFEDLTGRKPEEVFHTVYNTYESDWDEDAGVVLPEPLIRDALNARKMFPDKRVIIHFMQPHVPFVKSDIKQSPQNPPSEKSSIEIDNNVKSEIMRAKLGEIDAERVVKDYRENLEFIKPYIYDLTEKLEGRTLVTADHGELLGENDNWGHPGNSNPVKLRKVPLKVLSNE